MSTLFTDCKKVTVYCRPDSWQWDFYKKEGIPVKSSRPKLIPILRDAWREYSR